MKHTPMLFSTPMVLAILSGQKTQTRRAMKPQPTSNPPHDGGTLWVDERGDGLHIPCGSIGHLTVREKQGLRSPYGQPGDRIWVKETYYAWGRWETCFNSMLGFAEWRFVDMTIESGKAYQHLAGNDSPPLSRKRDAGITFGWWKRPSIFMPKHASRIGLEVTGVRVERLQDISAVDCWAEGMTRDLASAMGLSVDVSEEGFIHGGDARRTFQALWAQLNGPDSWPANPWVWVVEFKRIKTEWTPS